MEVGKVEVVLRTACMLLAAVTAALLGLDRETKTVFFVQRQATPKDIQALWVLTMAVSVAAGYHFLQLSICCCFRYVPVNTARLRRAALYIRFLLDQGFAYATFATTMAALQASTVALAGIDHLQWSKLCNIYTRFCELVGASLVCGLIASFFMAAVSSLSLRSIFLLTLRCRS